MNNSDFVKKVNARNVLPISNWNSEDQIDSALMVTDLSFGEGKEAFPHFVTLTLLMPDGSEFTMRYGKERPDSIPLSAGIVNRMIAQAPGISSKVSDGKHTFGWLYARIAELEDQLSNKKRKRSWMRRG